MAITRNLVGTVVLVLAVALGEPETEPQTLDSLLKAPEAPPVVRQAMASSMSSCTKVRLMLGSQLLMLCSRRTRVSEPSV